jgi:hypothetical protein
MDIDTAESMLIGGDAVVMLKEHLTAPVLYAHVKGVLYPFAREFRELRSPCYVAYWTLKYAGRLGDL